ncbi:MAG: hypothetical protein ACLGGV_09025 [Bacteroidia bacterium]
MSKPIVLLLILIVVIVAAYVNAYLSAKKGYRFDKTFIFSLIGLVILTYFILQFINF